MNQNNNIKVVVGLSGGVDSSVAAYLLKEQGYQVIGLFMKNWHDESVTISNECPWLEDSNDALLVAQKLGIPFQTVDLSEEYKDRIVDYMFGEYENGRTPNPDVLCNREIKFDAFLKIALSLGADFVATGHYCQKDSMQTPQGEIHRLLAGADPNKDQSYFLCQLSQNQLKYALFPIGHLQKSEVRQIAKDNDLITAEKKDSQGLCFIGKVSLPDFLQQQLKPKEGKVYEILSDSEIYARPKPDFESKDEELLIHSKNWVYTPDMGKEIGNHIGAHFFTIGQRKGLNIGGKKEPLFVLATDVLQNVIYVGQGSHHPGLWRNVLRIHPHEIHWIRTDIAPKLGESIRVKSRIRYRQPLQSAELYCSTHGLFVIFDEPQSAITEGQFAAFYLEQELIGSGVISN